MSDMPTPPTKNTPWFAVSIGLMGLIVGYGLSGLNGGTAAQLAPTNAGQVAQAPTAPAPTPAAPSNPPSIDGAAVLGKADAPVTLVEFTDYQCPFCERHFTQTFDKIKTEFVDTGKVKYAVRNYPLTFHPNAEPAAEAAECAGKQGKYFDMHNKLFAGNPTWSNLPDAKPTFEQYAKDIGLNTADFKTCLDSGTTKAKIQKDEADGNNAGISGTPGFWVIGKDGKGEIISGAQPFENFKTTIEKYLN